MRASYEFLPEKAPTRVNGPASCWVSDRVQPRHKEGGRFMRRNSIKVRGDKFTPQKNLSPIFSSSRAAKAEFAAVIRDSSTGTLARMIDGSKDTVKCWRARRSFPGGESLMEMAKEGGDESVREWVALKCGFIPPEMAEAMWASSYQVKHQNNPDGDAMRASIRQHTRTRAALYARMMGALQGLPDLDGDE